MQRFGLLLGVFLILTGLSVRDCGLSDIYTDYKDAKVCFYITRGGFDLDALSADVEITRNGAGLIISAAGDSAAKIRRGFSKITGESVAFRGNIADAEGIISFYRADTVYTETVPLSQAEGNGGGSITVIYAYSPLFKNAITLSGKKVNLQAAENNVTGMVTIGTPLILGSY